MEKRDECGRYFGKDKGPDLTTAWMWRQGEERTQ